MNLHFLFNVMKGLQNNKKMFYTPIQFPLSGIWGSARYDSAWLSIELGSSTKRHHTQVSWHLYNSYKAAEILQFVLLKTNPWALHCAAAWPCCWLWTGGQLDHAFSPGKEKRRQLSSTSARQIPAHGLDQLPGTYPKHHTADYIQQRCWDVFI